MTQQPRPSSGGLEGAGASDVRADTDVRGASGARGRARRIAGAAVVAGVVLAGATVTVLFAPGGERALPLVRLLEPSSAIPIEAGRATRVRGLILHERPIGELRVAGRRLSASFSDDRLSAEFSGYVDGGDVGGDGRIALEVGAMDGSTTVRRLPVDPRPAAGRGSPGFEEAAGTGRQQRWAVVIGAGAYEDDRMEPDAGAAERARAMAAFLRSPAAGLGGFAGDHLRVLVGADATARAVRSALTTFLRGATPDDLVVIYLAGRALPDPLRPDLLYLATHDTRQDDLPATGVGLGEIQRAIGGVYAANRLVLADLGPAAAALGDGIETRQGALVVVTAAPGAGGSGTRAIGALALDALRGAGDADGDGVVRLGELLDHARAGRATIAGTTYDRYWPMASVPVATSGRAVAEP